MRRKLRIGLAGVGPHLLEHLLPALRLAPGVEIRSAVSSAAAKRRELEDRLWIPKWFETIEALVDADACDAIVVSGSVDYHERVLAVGIRNHVPVFVEKPPARHLAALTDLARAAEEAGVGIAVGLNLPHTEIVARVEQYVAEARTAIHRVKVAYHTNKPRSPLWNLPSLLESFLLACAIHPLSLVRRLLGKSSRVASVRGRVGGDGIGLRIGLEGEGSLAEVVTSNRSVAGHTCHFEVDLDNGERLRADGLGSLARLAHGREDPIWNPSPLNLSLNSNGYLKEMDLFVQLAVARRAGNGLLEVIPIYRAIEDILHGSKNFEKECEICI